ncbi:hypothetical protein CW304_04535 [Bacillus sp. UFRGS-B20]|nr:hypothetical protein CW304_04535 [Bacillus sp. UFRGS-B20]
MPAFAFNTARILILFNFKLSNAVKYTFPTRHIPFQPISAKISKTPSLSPPSSLDECLTIPTSFLCNGYHFQNRSPLCILLTHRKSHHQASARFLPSTRDIFVNDNV